MTMKADDVFHLMEGIVSGYFGLSVDDMTSRKRTSDLVDARHFLWFILHDIYGYGPKKIAEYYGTSKQNIHYSVSIIRDGILLQPFYSRHYSGLLKIMKEKNITI